MKCKKCAHISHDYNHICPACKKTLTGEREDLGIYFEQPEVVFDEFFTGPSSAYRPARSQATQEAELDLGTGEDFEFTLD